MPHKKKSVEEIATSLRELVVRERKGRKWEYAFAEARWSPDPDEGSVRKARITPATKGKEKLVTLDTPVAFGDMLESARATHQKTGDKTWYGLTIIVYPDGKVETEFNYDPKCQADLAFYKT